jgi:hypothetical protein
MNGKVKSRDGWQLVEEKRPKNRLVKSAPAEGAEGAEGPTGWLPLASATQGEARGMLRLAIYGLGPPRAVLGLVPLVKQCSRLA